MTEQVRRRNRPGHHVQPLHRLQPGRRDRRRRPARAPPDLPQAGLGGARRHRDLVEGAGGGRRARSPRPGCAPTSSARSASPTSARRRSCGTGPPASRCTTPSSGRTPVPPRCATNWAARTARTASASRTGLPLASYFSGPKAAWLLDNVPGLRARAETRRDRLRHHRLLADLEPHRRHGRRRARHRRHQRRAHHADEPGDPPVGPVDPGRDERPRGDPAGDQVLGGGVRHRRGPARRACPWPPRWATSRRPCSARPATTSARPRTPTAPAASCCSTPGTGRCLRRTGC